MEKAYFISLMMDIRGGTLYRIYCPEDLDQVIRVDLPWFVLYHHGTGIYDQFYNLRYINAHYGSPCYESYDGCLYRKSGELLFVPMGKDSVRLSPSITSFDPAVFVGHDKLTQIEVPEDSPYIFRDGCLFSADMTNLYLSPGRGRTCLSPRRSILSATRSSAGPLSASPWNRATRSIPFGTERCS